MAPETFPILWTGNDELFARADGRPLVLSVPWVFVAGLETKAREVYGQGLREIARNGGLSANELLALADGRLYPDGWLKAERANAALAARLDTFTQATAAPAFASDAARSAADGTAWAGIVEACERARESAQLARFAPADNSLLTAAARARLVEDLGGVMAAAGVAHAGGLLDLGRVLAAFVAEVPKRLGVAGLAAFAKRSAP